MSDTLSFINLTDTSQVSEDELLDRARDGDRSAFGTLYLRHRDAARKVAAHVRLVGGRRRRRRGRGLRPGLRRPAPDGRAPDRLPALPADLRPQRRHRPAAAGAAHRPARRRCRRPPAPPRPTTWPSWASSATWSARPSRRCPARWRTVLWLTEVEGLSPAEVSRRIGIKPNAVAALAYRARKGLREAYLQAHLEAEASEECRATVGRLGHYVRGELAEKERARRPDPPRRLRQVPLPAGRADRRQRHPAQRLPARSAAAGRPAPQGARLRSSSPGS